MREKVSVSTPSARKRRILVKYDQLTQFALSGPLKTRKHIGRLPCDINRWPLFPQLF